MELNSEEVLSRDIQQVEHEFLDETVTDNEDSDEGERNDDCEFNDELEVAGEVIVNTSCCSIDEEVLDILSRTCGCTKRNGGPCSRELTSEDISDHWAEQLRVGHGYFGTASCWNECRWTAD